MYREDSQAKGGVWQVLTESARETRQKMKTNDGRAIGHPRNGDISDKYTRLHRAGVWRGGWT